MKTFIKRYKDKSYKDYDNKTISIHIDIYEVGTDRAYVELVHSISQHKSYVKRTFFCTKEEANNFIRTVKQESWTINAIDLLNNRFNPSRVYK